MTMRTRPGQVKSTGCSGGSACPFGLHQFDPKMEKFQTWAIPGGGDIVRNMDVDRDGHPVMANSPVNEVGVIEVKGPTHRTFVRTRRSLVIKSAVGRA
jgi:hypothetical protein